ncbi:hypothetical protein GCM10023192_61100 [Amycolatopsis samaneae]
MLRIECAACGKTVSYHGNGRRPKYCSRTYRQQRAYEVRNAATILGRGDPVPEVQTQVIVRASPRERPGTASTPKTTKDWSDLLATLTHKLRTNPASLLNDVDARTELRNTARELAMAIGLPDPFTVAGDS